MIRANRRFENVRNRTRAKQDHYDKFVPVITQKLYTTPFGTLTVW